MFPEFLSELKTELKVIETILSDSWKSRLIGIEQIEDTVGNHIIKKLRTPKNRFDTRKILSTNILSLMFCPK